MRFLFTIFLFCLGLFGFSHADAEQSDVSESYEITLGGQKIIADSGVSTNIVVDGKKLAVSVQGLPFKKFDDGDISFMFPTRHAVEKEQTETDTTWTLDGQDNVITVHKVNDMNLADNLVAELKRGYGKGTKVDKCQCWFGSNKINGQKISAKLAGQTIVQEIYNLPGSTNNYVFIIQNGSEDEIAETRMVKRKLKETFHMKSAQ